MLSLCWRNFVKKQEIMIKIFGAEQRPTASVRPVAVAEHINAAINANRQAKAEIDWQVYNPENIVNDEQ